MFSGADLDLFSINSGTGEISLRGSLDYEKATQHVLSVVADDGENTVKNLTKCTVLL